MARSAVYMKKVYMADTAMCSPNEFNARIALSTVLSPDSVGVVFCKMINFVPTTAPGCGVYNCETLALPSTLFHSLYGSISQPCHP